MNLTKRAIEGFAYVGTKPNAWDVRWDDDVKGLGLRIYPTGKKSFILRYSKAGGGKGTMVLGSYGDLTVKQARDLARTHKADIAKGSDPLAVKRMVNSAPTVSELCGKYMSEHARPKKKPKSVEEDERNIKLHLAPAIGKMKVRDVNRSDIAKLHHSLSGRPHLANRVLSLVSTMFNLAESWELRDDGSNPCRHVKAFKEEKREVFLTHEEIVVLIDVLDQSEREGSQRASVIAALRLLLHTGCRLNEILTLEWSFYDEGRQCLFLPDTKTGQRTVRLSSQAVAVLKGIKRVEGNPYVIIGHKRGCRLVNLQKPWRRIRAKARLDHVRIHDLRHTYASLAAELGKSLHEIGKLLGHSSQQTTARYSHLTDAHIADASEEIGDRIESVREGSGRPTAQ
jgi:integrase